MILNDYSNYSKLQKVLVVLSLIVVYALVIYGIYWVFKNVSYWFFYEDMVIETVKEMVRTGQLLSQ